MANSKNESETVKEWTLKAGEEFRFEVDFKNTITIKLLSGAAEYFGAEIGPTAEYKFNGENGAIFSWQGCKISVKGLCQSYIAEETPMDTYINVHMALQQMRVLARSEISTGSNEQLLSGSSLSESSTGELNKEMLLTMPRVMIVGPEDSGKTSLARILLNYAVRQEETPLYIDLDPRDASVSVPGTVSATPVTHTIDIESGFMGYALASSNAPPATPLVYQYGHENPSDNLSLFNMQVKKLSHSVFKRLSVDKNTAASGFIVDTSGVLDPSKYEAIYSAIAMLKINVLLVVGNERMYSIFSNKLLGDATSALKIIKMSKSGGVVDRDASFRRRYNSHVIRKYFYGTKEDPVSSFSTITNFNEVKIFRIGETAKAPSSTLPLGEARQLSDTSILTVVPDESLSHSILSVVDGDINDKEGNEAIVDKDSVGFVNVTSVDMAKNRLTLLSPVPGRFPKQALILGQIKWMET